MSVKIRLARHGSTNNPFYHVIAADGRAKRDGKFIEKLGTYNPTAPKTSAERIKLNVERVQHWLAQGATPSEGVKRFLIAANLITESKKDIALKNKAIARRAAAKKAAEDKAAAEAPAAA
jgi:small subunit ribosomal protein S16